MTWGLDLIWVTACAMVVLLIALWFVFHPDMKTGVLGTAGLAILALASLTRIAASWHDPDGHTGTLPLFVWTGMALYLGFIALGFRKRLSCKAARDPSWYEGGKRPERS